MRCSAFESAQETSAATGHRSRIAAWPEEPVREQLDVLRAAFARDPRPGVVFAGDRVLDVNDAARDLFSTASNRNALVQLTLLSVRSGTASLQIRIGEHPYFPLLVPAVSRAGYEVRICFLIRGAPDSKPLGHLSRGEWAVIPLLVRGDTNREIANTLGISVETVRKHVAHLLRKTGAKTRAGLVGRVLAGRPGATLPVRLQSPSVRQRRDALESLIDPVL